MYNMTEQMYARHFNGQLHVIFVSDGGTQFLDTLIEKNTFAATMIKLDRGVSVKNDPGVWNF